MELSRYLKILKKNFYILAIFAVLFSLPAFFFSSQKDKAYVARQNFVLVSDSLQKDSPNDYYQQEKARNFTDTAVSILRSPDFRGEVTGAGQSLAVSKAAPQIIEISARSASSQTSEQLLQKTVEKFNEKMKSISSSPNLLKPVGRSQSPFLDLPDQKIIIAFAAASGLLFGALVIAFKVYLKL